MFDIIYRIDPARPVERLAPQSADDARRRLEEGNRTFAGYGDVAGSYRSRVVHVNPEDIGVDRDEEVPRQRPFACVLGCSDARVPTELVFDRNCNELFVVRVAGNVLGQEQLGSIDYAVENLGADLKLLVVLGHSRCGAVTAAVDAFLKPSVYLGFSASHHVRAIVNSLFPAVRGASDALTARWGPQAVGRPGYRDALIEASVVLNAALTASILQAEFGDADRDLRIVFGVYDLRSRRVTIPTAETDGEAPKVTLTPAPAGAAEFLRFAERTADSPAVSRYLAY